MGLEHSNMSCAQMQSEDGSGANGMEMYPLVEFNTLGMELVSQLLCLVEIMNASLYCSSQHLSES